MQEAAVTIKTAASLMSNTFSFDTQGLIAQIMADRELADCYACLASAWVAVMGARYREGYPDRRDLQSVRFCRQVMQLPEADKTIREYAGDEPPRAMPFASYLAREMVTYMHPTLRQTFTGLVISFLLQYAPFENLAREVEKNGLAGSREVRFPMV